MLCFFDARTKVEQRIVPMRKSILLGVRRFGSFCVLDFCLDEFVCVKDLADFNKALASRSDAVFPHWENDALVGNWVHETSGVTDLCGDGETQTPDHIWQTVARQLHTTQDFANEPYFYRLSCIRQNERRILPDHEGVVKLFPDSSVRMEIEHFSPGNGHDALDGNRESHWLIVESDGGGLKSASAPRIGIDSPYDQKTVSFRTVRGAATERAFVRFAREIHAGDTTAKVLVDFEITLEVRRDIRTPIVVAVILGLLLALQQWDTFVVGGEFDECRAAKALTLGILTGLVAAFGLQKPE